MRKIILMMSISVDGYFTGPDGELDWHLVDEELHAHFNVELAAMSAFLHGRVMYELMAGYWPTADQDPAAPAPIVEFARIWREMPKLVFSRTLEQAGWNSTLVRAVDPDYVRELQARPGGDLVVGGPTVAAAFEAHGLIDEYRLYVHPVVLGAGRALFPAGTPKADLRLAESRAFGNGVVLVRYLRDGRP